MKRKKDPLFKEVGFQACIFGPTRNAGVYAICVVKESYYPAQLKELRVVYIGSAKNIKSRLSNSNHVYRRLYSICKNYFISVFWIETLDFLSVEKSLIKKYKPRFNITHKNG